MTRDEFFNDLNDVVRLLGRLGLPAELEAEAAERVATMRAGGPGVTAVDLHRYSDTIDWTRQDDIEALRDLARVLLRVLGGLGSELESFRRARG
jgi:hypothetical protein